MFVLEVVGLFVFHLLAMPMQLGLFFKNRYFWFLAIISLGGVAGAAWWVTTPNSAGNFMAAFQVRIRTSYDLTLFFFTFSTTFLHCLSLYPLTILTTPSSH